MQPVRAWMGKIGWILDTLRYLIYLLFILRKYGITNISNY